MSKIPNWESAHFNHLDWHFINWKIRIGNQPISTKQKESYIFHVRPKRGTNNSKLKYKLVEDTIRIFLVTWQKINWIGFLRRCKFWPVVFLWSNLWRHGSLRWQFENSHYKIYPTSYSDELINLCWYCWGGGLYPSRRFAGVEFVWNIDNLRPAVGCTFRQDLIRSVTTQIRDCQQNQSVQSSLFISTEEKLISLISPVCRKVDKWANNWMGNN